MAGVIVHEWIEKIGGSEKVLDAMVETFPDADILSAWNNAPDRYPGRTVGETWLARTPLRGKKALALAAMPLSWRGLKNHDYDWALVSSHAFAHHAKFRGQAPDFRKLVYVHTPARYIWTPELDERGNNAVIRAAAGAFKGLDRRRASESTRLAANSAFVRDRIQQAWGLDSAVIHPPVDVEEIQSVPEWADRLTESERELLDSLPEGFVLGASRFIPYKRVDLAIDVAEAAGLSAVLAGGGPEHAALRARADASTASVTIVDSPSDAMLRALYQRASVYVFPAIEDFGIMPVEAMAAGTPVISGAIGGAAESVVPGVSGVRVSAWDVRSALNEAVEQALALPPEVVAEHARAFSRERFQRELKNFVAND